MKELSQENIEYLLSLIINSINAGLVDIATVNQLGLVKPDGTTITIDSNGTLTANIPTIDIATVSQVGIAKPDNDSLTIDSNGVLSISDVNYTNAELSQMWATAKNGGSQS